MADTIAFIDNIRNLIALSENFTRDGFTHEQVYRQFITQVKDPIFPCITLSFEKQHVENFAGINSGMLYVSVHMKQFAKTQIVADWLTKLLGDYKFSDGTLVIYKCQEEGGPPTPTYDTENECWESMQGFDAMFG